MRLFIRCDQEGKILSAMKVCVMPETLEHPYAHSSEEGEQILEIDADPAVAALDAHEVVEQYAVDTTTGKLRKLTRAGPQAGESAPPQPRPATPEPKQAKPK